MAKKDKFDLPPIVRGQLLPDTLPDLTGRTFGWLTVEEFGGRDNTKHRRGLWICRCKCDKVCLISHRCLTNGTKSIKHCGCLEGDSVKDLTGQRFGRLVAIEFTGKKNSQNNYIWIFRCDCGNLKECAAGSVIYYAKSGYGSCGCLQKEAIGHLNYKHGYCINYDKPRLFSIWNGMRQRCYNENDSFSYPNYGGRGITVCEEWRQSFKSFHDWALENGYADELSIDRIDVNGNYCPENCRWSTWTEQANNKRTTKRHRVFGVHLTIAEASRRYRVKYGSLQRCMYHRKHTLEQAVIHCLRFMRSS